MMPFALDLISTRVRGSTRPTAITPRVMSPTRTSTMRAAGMGRAAEKIEKKLAKPPKRYDQPDRAMEFFLRQRLVDYRAQALAAGLGREGEAGLAHAAQLGRQPQVRPHLPGDDQLGHRADRPRQIERPFIE